MNPDKSDARSANSMQWKGCGAHAAGTGYVYKAKELEVQSKVKREKKYKKRSAKGVSEEGWRRVCGHSPIELNAYTNLIDRIIGLLESVI